MPMGRAYGRTILDIAEVCPTRIRTCGNQYRATCARTVAPRSMPEAARNPAGQTSERFGNRSIPSNPPAARQQNRGAFGGMENGAAANTHAEHGMSSLGPSPQRASTKSCTSAKICAAPRGNSGGGQRR